MFALNLSQSMQFLQRLNYLHFSPYKIYVFVVKLDHKRVVGRLECCFSMQRLFLVKF